MERAAQERRDRDEGLCGLAAAVERDLLAELAGRERGDDLCRLSGMPGVGLAAIKLEGTLKEASSAFCMLHACGLQNSWRNDAIAMCAELSGMPDRALTLRKLNRRLARTLRLLRYPILGIGMEMSRVRVGEMKAYFQINKACEFLDLGNVSYSPTEQFLEADAIRTICRTVTIGDDARAKALSLARIGRMHRLSVEMVGVDFHRCGGVEMKTYLSTAEGKPGLTGADGFKTAQGFLEEVGSEMGMTSVADRAVVIAERMILRYGLALNQMAVDEKPDGTSELKFHFDLWDQGEVGRPEGMRITIGEERTAEIVSYLFKATGRDEEQTYFREAVRRFSAGNMDVDCFSVDFAVTGDSPKAYLRSRNNLNGNGVTFSETRGQML